jgi:hypothetical protein
MVLAQDYLKLLFANLVRLWPIIVSALEDAGLFHDALQLVQDYLVYEHFFAKEGIGLVLAVVGISQPPIWFKFEFKKFVAEFTLVANASIEIRLWIWWTY